LVGLIYGGIHLGITLNCDNHACRVRNWTHTFVGVSLIFSGIFQYVARTATDDIVFLVFVYRRTRGGEDSPPSSWCPCGCRWGDMIFSCFFVG